MSRTNTEENSLKDLLDLRDQLKFNLNKIKCESVDFLNCKSSLDELGGQPLLDNELLNTIDNKQDTTSMQEQNKKKTKRYSTPSKKKKVLKKNRRTIFCMNRTN